MQEIPVYLFTGFMDSGKTTLIKETLFENDFGGDNRTVIIVCEDGDEEYDEGKLNTINAKVAMVRSRKILQQRSCRKFRRHTDRSRFLLSITVPGRLLLCLRQRCRMAG